MKLGISLSSTSLPLRTALAQAARWGVAGVQLDATGDLSPERLTATGRRELRNLLKTYNLDLTSIQCPMRRGLDVAENQQIRIEYLQNAMIMAFDLGPRMVVVQCPHLPDQDEVVRAGLLNDAILALGKHGDRVGTTVALEIGIDPSDKVRDYLKTFDVGSLGVNYDPANFLMHGHDPIKNLLPLAGRIVHTHARDARMASVSRTVQEVPVGAGDIDWMGYVGTLAAMEYHGWFVVKRESGDDRVKDIGDGVAFLKRFLL